MDADAIRKLLRDVKHGTISEDEAVALLKAFPMEDLGFAKIDHHRALRRGFPEVVLCEGKTAEQVAAISERILAGNVPLLATRVSPQQAEAIQQVIPDAEYNPTARTVVARPQGRESPKGQGQKGTVLIVSAGTSDIPVAEEAAVTAEVMGNHVERVFDVGVAGIHRLLAHRAKLSAASVIIVVAGMEGALASVVGGLVDVPVIAVPTSVGYGASFQGLAALLGMLNSCAGGVTVVNIDNGFGAGYAASLINLKRGWMERGPHPET
jgi:hypothetical protein